ncbi:MAG TPA: trypco2 family protein [Armatimonadota bacterium]|nr:trypco2 family protein [Armatimonadota bacterium]
MPENKPNDRAELAELVEFVSRELRKVDEKLLQSGKDPVMRFLECEIDCAIDVEVKGEGGLHVWVVNLGAGAKRSETNTIKVKYSALPSTDLVAAIRAGEGQKPIKKAARSSRKLTGGQ